MKRTRLAFWVTVVAATLLLVLMHHRWSSTAVAGSDQAAASTTSDPMLVEYTIPRPGGQPRNLVVESAGRVWFTLPGANAIGRLVASGGTPQFDIFDLPTPNGEPYDIAFDGQDVWFTAQATGKLGRWSAQSQTITEYTIPTPNSEPAGIAVAPDGTVWFAAGGSNEVGRFDPDTTSFTMIPYTMAGAALEDVAVASDEVIWFTAPGLNQVLQYEVDTGTFTRVFVNDFGMSPWPPGDIAMGARGLPWITSPTTSQVGRYAPGTQAFWRWFNLPTVGSNPTGIAVRLLNNQEEVWFTSPGSGRAGVLLTNSAGRAIYLLERNLPGNNSQPRGIDVDGNGHVWIAASGANTIVEWRPPYFFSIDLPAVFSP